MAGSTITNTVLFTVKVDGSNVQKDMAGIQQTAKTASANISTSLKNMGNNAKNAGMAMTLGLTVPLLAAGKAALGIGMDFQQGLANIEAVTGATSDEMKQFEKVIRDTAKSTPYSTKEISQAVEDLAKAGLTTEQILNGALYGSLTLAAAGEIDLAEAANLAARALITFKDDNLSVAEAADILVGAANKSTTSVGEMGSSFEMVSVVAATAGVTMKDTATALAVFAQNGMSGSDAGTSLKTMLMNLNPQTKKASDLMKQLGIINEKNKNTFYDESGNLKDMAGIAQVVQDAFQGMGTEARLSAMRIIFGQDAIRGASVLYESGAEGIREMAKAMEEVKAQEVAEKKWATLANDWKKLKNNAADLAITMSKWIIPILDKIVKKMTAFTKSLGNIPEGMQKIVVGFLLVIAAIGPLLLIFGSFAGAIGSIIELLGMIGITSIGSFGALLGPVLLVVAGVAFLILLFKKLWDTSESFRNNVKDLLKTIGDSFQNMKTALEPVGEQIVTFLKNMMDGMMPYIEDLMDYILPTLGDIIKNVTDIIAIFATKLSDSATNADDLAAAGEGLGKALGVMSEVAYGPLKALLWVIDKIIEGLKWIMQQQTASGPTPEFFKAAYGGRQSTGKELGGESTANSWGLPWKANGGLSRANSAAIVGEAGPELLTVGYKGTEITPLTGAAKARNVEQAFGGSNVFNISVEGGWDNADRIANRVADTMNMILGSRGVNYVR